MTLSHFLQAAIVLVAAATPLIVVRIVAARAPGTARAISNATPPSFGTALRRLNAATVVVSAPVLVLAFLLPPPSLALGTAALGAFAICALLGLQALHALDVHTRPLREVATTDRIASLQPRDVGRYVPVVWRVVLYALTTAGVAAFIYQWLLPAAGRRPFVPATFALGAVVFLLLYDAWMRDEVQGGQAEGGPDAAALQRRITRIHRMQIALVTGFLILANILVGLDWTHHADSGVLCALGGAVLGVAGCANAIASGYTTRRYAPAPPRPADHSRQSG